MLTSFAARAALAAVLVANVFDLSARAQATFVEPVPESEIQFTIGGVRPQSAIRLWTVENFGQGPAIDETQLADTVRRCKEIAAAAPPPQAFPPSPAPFDLQFTVNSPPVGAAAAIAAIETYFESVLTTAHASGPIQITVNFGVLAPGTLMVTNSTLYNFNYAAVSGVIHGNADSDDLLYTFSPTPTMPVQFSFGGAVTNAPDFFMCAGTIVGTIPFVVGGVVAPHATITVSSTVVWDYDPSNGITGGQMCFRSAFAHEIGHALGFNSAISVPAPMSPFHLDFLRFQRTANNPTGFTDFKNRARLVHLNTPNDDHELSFVHAHYPMEDGNPQQASHFREQVPNVGLMDPSLSTGETFFPNYLRTSDLRVLDYLGFDWNDPEFIATSSYRFDVEPNGQKSEASPATNMSPGTTIVGTTTGTSTTLGDTTLASSDMFRVQTSALPLGIYRHTLTLTSATSGAIAAIRGRNQVAGVIGTVDSLFQTSQPVASNRESVWYGFGKQEEIYYAVTGTGSTTALYNATLSTSTITAQNIAGSFVAGPITIASAVGQTTDTEIYLYDSNLNPVALGHNDDPAGGPGTGPSLLNINLAAGTYYVASSTFNTANNQSDGNPTEFYQGEFVLDFPNVLVNNSVVVAPPVSYTVSDGVVTTPVTASHASIFDINWGRFTVVSGAPRNDLCANAVSAGVGTTIGNMLGATHDGSAACDPGGLTSKDVWFTHTNSSGGVRLLSATTCGTTGVNDTVLSIHNSCGGALLACNDTCGGSPCGGPASCVSGVSMNPGQTVWIRVSDKGLGSTTGTFSLNLTETIPPPSNDSCTTPISINGFGTFTIDNTGATTGAQGQAEALCNFFGGTAIRQDTWFTWTPTQSGTVTVTTCGLLLPLPSEDSKIAIYTGAGCPVGSAIACNDDALSGCPGFSAFNASVSFPAVCGTTYTLQMGMYQGSVDTMIGSFSISGSGPACPTPTTSICKGDGTGAACPCGNTSTLPGSGCASPFFGGAGSTLSSTGVASISADTLVLSANNVPGPGLFIQANPGSQVNFGDGHLCSTNTILRMGVVFASGGIATYPGGLTPNPIHIAGSTANGNTRVYQCWYRSSPSICSPAALYNLTQGLQLTWGP